MSHLIYCCVYVIRMGYGGITNDVPYQPFKYLNRYLILTNIKYHVFESHIIFL